MVTAQNVRDVRFTKTMGGYKTAEVDAFLDQCAETIDALNSDIEENTRKMQVLAETIVDYRNQEDSIRTALLSAQRMSETVINEAKEQAESIVSNAQEKANNIEEESKKSIQSELDELARIQKEVAAFRSRLLATYREHLTLIGILSDESKDAPSQDVIEEPVAEQEETFAEDEQAAFVPDLSSDIAEDIKIDISAFELQDEE